MTSTTKNIPFLHVILLKVHIVRLPYIQACSFARLFFVIPHSIYIATIIVCNNKIHLLKLVCLFYIRKMSHLCVFSSCCIVQYDFLFSYSIIWYIVPVHFKILTKKATTKRRRWTRHSLLQLFALFKLYTSTINCINDNVCCQCKYIK